MPQLDTLPRTSGGMLTESFGARAACSSTDEELLAQFRADGAQAAFAALVERHGLMVIRICRRILGNAADAEDVAQAVFLTLARQPGAVRVRVAGWLYETARGRALNALRSRRRRASHEERAAARPASTLDESASDLGEELEVALNQLRTRLRQAVVLRYVEGRSLAEAAQAAGCPPGTLGRRSMEGLRQLRSILTRRVVRLAAALAALVGAHAKMGIAAVVIATGVGLTLLPTVDRPADNVKMIAGFEEIPEGNAAMMRPHWPGGIRWVRGYVTEARDGTVAAYAAGTTAGGDFYFVYSITAAGKPFYLVVNGQHVTVGK
jgi:RNA polymerase sigma factor (sigma-70 family)